MILLNKGDKEVTSSELLQKEGKYGGAKISCFLFTRVKLESAMVFGSANQTNVDF